MNKFVFYSLLTSLALTLAGCGDAPQAVTAAPPQSGQATESQVEPFEIQYENFEDPEFAKTPRVQFVWNPPGTPENNQSRGIWTMRLDGSDLRLAVPPELFTSPTSGSFDMTVPFERSPNLRYIAWVMEGECPTYCYQRRLIDLKTKEVKILTSESGGPPRFHWTKDSRHLYFKFRGRLNRYDVDTHQVVDIDDRFEKKTTEGFTLSHDEKTLIGATFESIDYYDLFSGKLLRSDSLKGNKKFSADSTYIMVGEMGKDTWDIYDIKMDNFIFSFPLKGQFVEPFIWGEPLFFLSHRSTRKVSLLQNYAWLGEAESVVAELPKGGGRATNISYIFGR